MAKPKGTKALTVTPELIDSIKTMAYIGLSKSDICDKLNRHRDTLFYNNAILENAYIQGKADSKDALLANVNKLAHTSKSDETKLKASQYILNINHRVIPSNNITIEGNDVPHTTV